MNQNKPPRRAPLVLLTLILGDRKWMTPEDTEKARGALAHIAAGKVKTPCG